MKTAKDIIMNIITDELGENFTQKEKIADRIVKELHLENVKTLDIIEGKSSRFNPYECEATHD